MIRKKAEITPAQLYFDEELPYNVSRVSESYSLQLHEHEFTEICYVAEGRGFHYIGEETLSVSPGDLFILPLGTSHVFRPRSTDPEFPLVVYNFIFIAGRVAEALQQFPGLDGLTAVLPLLNLVPGQPEWKQIRDTTGVFQTLLVQAYQEFRQRRIGFVPRMHSLFIMLATELERHLTELENEIPMKTERKLGAAISFIRENLSASITAGQASIAAGLSERHFHRLFVKEIGFTFTQYVQNLRIERSCELLRTTRLPVSEIAEAVGYQDKGFFVKLFKKRTGHTPRSYRNG
ncbi:helix-turn-helix transcriptional regulator [Paenibacillus frigoriresistens]|uniref:AraC family transcriptional regulator n=1 Tax=Paenibacillus alginolyticus TaxID=59839 RepID=UPI0015664E29|nr:AraC family transcriptional regulator [Paenibacillus frigoriresistens]NRF94570.1 helix-turn-helix transcriptional regulator [Paenibacillus frigoriresistens]